jgi:hypothetical protein
MTHRQMWPARIVQDAAKDVAIGRIAEFAARKLVTFSIFASGVIAPFDLGWVEVAPGDFIGLRAEVGWSRIGNSLRSSAASSSWASLTSRRSSPIGLSGKTSASRLTRCNRPVAASDAAIEIVAISPSRNPSGKFF